METAPEGERQDRRGAKPGEFGQQPHERDPQIAVNVANMAAAGGRLADIALALGISRTTLKTYYLPEWRSGRARAMLNVGNTVYQAAMAGNMSAAALYLGRLFPEVWGRQRESGGSGGGEAPGAQPPVEAIPPAPVRLVFVKTPPPGKGSVLPEDPAFLRERPDDGEG